jgi:hypothetical protein
MLPGSAAPGRTVFRLSCRGPLYARTDSHKFPDTQHPDYPRSAGLHALSRIAVARVKVLLDENIPHDLRPHLSHHDTYTVAYLGWAGLKNGLLLEAAEEGGFEVLVSGDLSLSYQQNLTGRRISIVSLSAIGWPIIEPHVARIVKAVDKVKAGGFVRVGYSCQLRRRSQSESAHAVLGNGSKSHLEPRSGLSQIAEKVSANQPRPFNTPVGLLLRYSRVPVFKICMISGPAKFPHRIVDCG